MANDELNAQLHLIAREVIDHFAERAAIQLPELVADMAAEEMDVEWFRWHPALGRRAPIDGAICQLRSLVVAAAYRCDDEMFGQPRQDALDLLESVIVELESTAAWTSLRRRCDRYFVRTQIRQLREADDFATRVASIIAGQRLLRGMRRSAPRGSSSRSRRSATTKAKSGSSGRSTDDPPGEHDLGRQRSLLAGVAS